MYAEILSFLGWIVISESGGEPLICYQFPRNTAALASPLTTGTGRQC